MSRGTCVTKKQCSTCMETKNNHPSIYVSRPVLQKKAEYLEYKK